MRRIDDSLIIRLLSTTARGYRDIAQEANCSFQNVARIALKFSLNTPERRAASHLRAQSPRRLRPGKYSGVQCPYCQSTLLRAWDKHGNRYGTPRYKCVDCGRKFLKEYKWISSGDRDRHLAIIARSSGYSRPDSSLRLAKYWQRWRCVQYWPYVDSYDGLPLLKVINDIIPRSLPEHIRADICQDAVLLALQGEKIVLKPLLSKWFRDNTSYALSLDGPSLSHENKTLGEALGMF